MAASRRRLYAVFVCIGVVLGLGLLNPGTALAYHNAYTSLYVSTAGVPHESVLFGDHAGTSFYVSPGTTVCCYVRPDAYVPAAISSSSRTSIQGGPTGQLLLAGTRCLVWPAPSTSRLGRFTDDASNSAVTVPRSVW
jgi:hypothetical protein